MIFPRHGAENHGAAATTGAATAGSSMADMDMSGGGDGHGSGGGGGGMMMMMMSVFQNDPKTALYSTGWTPKNAAGYAATIIFLVLLAVLFRCLLAAKAWQEARWLDAELKRRYVVVNGRLPMAERAASVDSFAKQPRAVLSSNGVEEDVVVVKKHTTGPRPWRLSVDPLRAVIDTVIAATGYLLMLAVMTMNIGYFLAVLGGTFLGSLAVGRFSSGSEH
ncbi:copper transporter [Gaeumannomyces tritici R3-111a-1]|uniref:Copper transport protein n=1 Tax=Gaeumannomyces tritici (strain R3-111a-1) TaxID=644352 RepID=J3PJF5_GAET3|nr:copper transporter [Gaeumannomyces tritici R3-111a-1]EJT68794.1 copper transporter [Gaeumannomyces tritici R3-111a-1]